MIKVQGREYEFSEDDSLIKDLVSKGLLERIRDDYRWTEKSYRKHIKGAKHIMRYMRNPFYRYMYKSWSLIKNTFV